MYIVDVIPIAKGISSQTLTYFTTKEVEPGLLVKVPLRKKQIFGLVTGCHDAELLRGEIRSMDFEIKKISKIEGRACFLPEFMLSIEEISEYFASSIGACLTSLVPKSLFSFFENRGPALISFEENISSPDRKSKNIHEKYLIQANDEERFDNYKNVIREEFAKKSSVIMILPTIQDIESATMRLSKGIEKFCFDIHSGYSEKTMHQALEIIVQEKHPVLILTTGSFLSIPRTDIGAIIVERENSRSYKSQVRPYIDHRVVAEIIAKNYKARLILGDSLISAETMYRHEQGEFADLYTLKFRTKSSAETLLVDMTVEKKDPEKFLPSEKKDFAILSHELLKTIHENIYAGQSMFIFNSRKGLWPNTICGDCGTMVICDHCGANVVLHTSSSSLTSPSSANHTETTTANSNGGLSGGMTFHNFYLCHKCGQRKDSTLRCKNCTSWKLLPLGVGIDRVKLEIKKYFENANIFVLDKETAPTHKKALVIMKDFSRTPGSILLGTEMALPYIKQVEYSAISSLDSFFSVPDFDINEKIAYILIKIKSITNKKFIIQSRKINEEVFKYVLQDNMADFLRSEIDMRRQFEYPPFFTFISITIEGRQDKIAEEMALLQKACEPFIIDVFPSYIKAKNGKSQLRGLVKVESKDWPNKHLLKIIRSAPPDITFKINPDSLV